VRGGKQWRPPLQPPCFSRWWRMRSGDGLMLGEVEADRPHPHAHIFISLQFGPSFAAFVEANEIITMS
jgi:hypothetical protein